MTRAEIAIAPAYAAGDACSARLLTPSSCFCSHNQSPCTPRDPAPLSPSAPSHPPPRAQGTFTAADFVPLPPSVLLLGLSTVEAVTTFPQFVSKLKAGEIYANVHSVRLAAGEARGNFQQQ